MFIDFLELANLSGFHYTRNMEKGEWYKTFGSHNIQSYYNILGVNGNEKVEVVEYSYSKVFRKILSQKTKTIPFKDWTEDVVQNNVHSIPKEKVPFRFIF